MHAEARHFVEWCAAHFGPFFGRRVLDVGSGDINGTNRPHFEGCDYVGCDVAPGPNVDVVSPCHDLPFPPASFDVVVSTECLEHDMHWRRTLAKIAELLRPGGLFVMTCASTGRPEHGTLAHTAHDSFTTRAGDPEWASYYRNLTANDIADALPLDDLFPLRRLYYNPATKDLYMYGVKALPPYAPNTAGETQS